ncbi:hypothetical protein ABT272_28160 [Streptomyces sp900105245]|uniref:Uncharacterized protein n=1 Tax=Streptomyces sp. 900105245 TaxID=3154379 RepID=A0ABV1UCY4_9ACTN
MSLRDFARSLKPGADRQLADDLAARQRVRRSRAATKADRKGQAWEAKDRAAERKGGWRITDWGRS